MPHRFSQDSEMTPGLLHFSGERAENAIFKRVNFIQNARSKN